MTLAELQAENARLARELAEARAEITLLEKKLIYCGRAVHAYSVPKKYDSPQAQDVRELCALYMSLCDRVRMFLKNIKTKRAGKGEM